ncbi:MAG: helix-turn-helix domain-containing protein [Candidatus Methylacidiphilales bacterium]
MRHASQRCHVPNPSRKAPGQPNPFASAYALSFTQHAEVQSALWTLLAVVTPLLSQAGMELRPLEISDPAIASSMAMIDELALSLPWDRQLIAQKSGISPSQLDRRWRDELGQTPHYYWDQRRLRFARERLEITSHSIKEVASDLGFTHLARFSNWFRSRQGTSPPSTAGDPSISPSGLPALQHQVVDEKSVGEVEGFC